MCVRFEVFCRRVQDLRGVCSDCFARSAADMFLYVDFERFDAFSTLGPLRQTL